MNTNAAIALDLGTTSIKGGLLERDGTLTHIISRPSPKINTGDRYESNALSYAKTAEKVLQQCVLSAGDCTSLGMCSQRSSFLIWERANGKPVTPLISWQDRRGMSVCDELRLHEAQIRKLTGLPLTPYYFAPKLRILLRDNLGWQARLESGEYLVGTLDTFLIWRWSSGRHFVTDASMAARTQLMDIREQKWSRVLCELFGIPLSILPEIIPSTGMSLELGGGLRLQASVADQSAALYAGISVAGTEAMANLGTGCFVVRYQADDRLISSGYLHTLVYQDQAWQPHYAVEGTLNSIAVALSPYPVDGCDIGELAQNDIFCIAEPTGLGAPYFRGDLGLRFSESVDHLPRRTVGALVLESVIFRVARIVEEFHRNANLDRLYLSGGLAELACLQQGIAQCVPCEVYRLRQNETSLQGAGMLAAGIPPANQRDADRIKGSDTVLLADKYRRWSAWFEGLLAQKNPVS